MKTKNPLIIRYVEVISAEVVDEETLDMNVEGDEVEVIKAELIDEEHVDTDVVKLFTKLVVMSRQDGEFNKLLLI